MLYVYETTTGRIVQKVIGGDGDAKHYVTSNLSALVTESDYVDSLCYVELGKLVQTPERPSADYDFNIETKTWVANLTLAERNVRGRRYSLLLASDWTQLPDVPLATKEVWAIYRQALRDITDQEGFPLTVVWPSSPNVND